MIFIWLFGYATVHFLSEKICSIYLYGEWLAAGMIGIFFFLFFLILGKNRISDFGINIAGRKDLIRTARFWSPLLLLPAINMIFNRGISIASVPSLFLLLFDIFAEELFFRSVLPDAICRKVPSLSADAGTVVANVIFAVFHFVNLFSGASVEYTIIQVIGAFFIGMSFAVIKNRTGSILPCVFIHFLINLSASGAPHGGICSTNIISVILTVLLFILVTAENLKYSKGKRK